MSKDIQKRFMVFVITMLIQIWCDSVYDEKLHKIGRDLLLDIQKN